MQVERGLPQRGSSNLQECKNCPVMLKGRHSQLERIKKDLAPLINEDAVEGNGSISGHSFITGEWEQVDSSVSVNKSFVVVVGAWELSWKLVICGNP